MLGSGGVRVARNHSDDRFYSPPAIRRQLQQQQYQQQQKQNHLKIQKEKRGSILGIGEVDNVVESDDFREKRTIPSSLVSNNLDRFVESTTPTVSMQILPKRNVGGWRRYEPFFILGDLWESFKEWSAYGAGVPLLLNGSNSVIQYYVPYLSAIQLYPVSSMLNEGEFLRESSSEGSSSDCELDQSSRSSHNRWGKHNTIESTAQRINRSSIRDSGRESIAQEGNKSFQPQGHPVFEYFEQAPPYSREPLADKISVLAQQFPQLKSYRSCDLSPASWLSVAWYPIYRIPTGPTLKDLDACFLTFHSLSTSSRSSTNGQPQVCNSNVKRTCSNVDSHSKLPLPIFGLASYKFKSSVWTHTEVAECQRVSSLLQSADNWIRLLQVDHPDFRFFNAHNSPWH